MKKEKVVLVIKKKRKRKNNSAVSGRLHLVVTPEQRKLIDEISKHERISVNFFCTYGLTWFLRQYQKCGNLFEIGGPMELSRPGAKRRIHELE